jgi:hypothetical protein
LIFQESAISDHSGKDIHCIFRCLVKDAVVSPSGHWTHGTLIGPCQRNPDHRFFIPLHHVNDPGHVTFFILLTQALHLVQEFWRCVLVGILCVR